MLAELKKKVPSMFWVHWTSALSHLAERIRCNCGSEVATDRNQSVSWGLRRKGSACNTGDLGSIPRSGRYPGRRERLPTPVFLPGEFHGQRSLAGYSPWSQKESDTAEQLTLLLSGMTLGSQ